MLPGKLDPSAPAECAREFLPTLAFDAYRAGPVRVLRSAGQLFALDLAGATGGNASVFDGIAP